VKPILQAILVADHIYTDQTTGKKIVAGIFNSLRFEKSVAPSSQNPEARNLEPTKSQTVDSSYSKSSVTGSQSAGEFGSTHNEGGRQNKDVMLHIGASGHKAGSPFCYISLTEIRGEQTFELRYVDLQEDKTIFRTTFEIQSNDPLLTKEVVAPLPVLPVSRAGTFALELLWNNETLGSHRINYIENRPEGDSR
jgi:hypothetical protein